MYLDRTSKNMFKNLIKVNQDFSSNCILFNFSGSLTMKRKRGKGKPRQNKSHVMVENEPDLNTVQDDVHVELDYGINTQKLQTDFSMGKQHSCVEKLVNEKSEKNVNSLGNRTCQEESRLAHQDPRYDEEELSAALLVCY